MKCSIYSILMSSLVFFCVPLSLPSGVPDAFATTELENKLAFVEKQRVDLDGLLKGLLRAKTSRPTAEKNQQAQRAEIGFAAWRDEIEKLIEIPDFLPIFAKLKLIDSYFYEFKDLFNLRISQNLYHGQKWWEPLALHLSKKVMSDFPILAGTVESRDGRKF